MNTDDIGTVEVCVDCYVAHHFGATKIEREATEGEENAWLHGHDDRSIMGLEFIETEHGLMVAEWFAGDSDQRCEGGEPLADLPEYGHESHGQRVTYISDYTCSNHEVYQLDDEDAGYNDTTVCPHCGQDGYEDGITEFTWRSCDGCNSHLGGQRYRLAIHWETIKEDA
jgi:hypothetical protein